MNCFENCEKCVKLYAHSKGTFNNFCITFMALHPFYSSIFPFKAVESQFKSEPFFSLPALHLQTIFPYQTLPGKCSKII